MGPVPDVNSFDESYVDGVSDAFFVDQEGLACCDS